MTLDEMIDLIDSLLQKEYDQGIDPVLTMYQTEELLKILNDYKQLKQTIKPRKSVPHAPPGFKCVRARFIGRDGSCGFNATHIYDLWMTKAHGKIYISRRDLDAMAIPYDTETAFRKNWEVIEG